MKLEAEFAVMVWPPSVRIAGAAVDEGFRELVEVPMTRKLADGARDMVAPAAVMIPPGVRVWEPIMKFEAELAVNDWPPSVMTAGLLVTGPGS